MSILVAFFAILLAIWFYRKTMPELENKQKIWLIFLRSISFLILIILLLNPILKFEKEEIIKPLAIILKDNSASMLLPTDDKTKSEVFQTYLSKTQDLLKKQYQIVEYNFAADLAGDSATTMISKSLQTLLQKHMSAEIGEIFLFSDGWFQDDNLQTLQNLNIPINCFLPEISQDIPDLMIHSLEKNETAFIDDINPLQVNLQANDYSGIGWLEVFYEGKIKRQEVDFSKADFQSISFDLKFESSGLKKISAEIVASDLAEKNMDNNKIETAIKVEKQRRKVLIISDKLNWDIRFLQNALQADNKFNTVLLTKSSTLRKARQKVNLAQEIKSIDLLILSNFGELRFSPAEQDLISSYHANGGSILFWGEYLAQLSEILPGSATSIRSEFSATFSLDPSAAKYATFDFEPTNIPPLKYKYVRPKAEAEILATFDNAERSPFILYSQINAKVIHLIGQGLWRWQMQSDELRFNIFILDLANWLSTKSKNNFESFSNKSSYQIGEKVEIELIAYDEKLQRIDNLNAKITLTKAGELIEEKYLTQQRGKYLAAYQNLAAGDYRYKIEDDKSRQSSEGKFVVFGAGRESRDFGINKTMLSYIANLTSGKIITPENISDQTFTASARREISSREIPLYKKYWLIITFLLSFCLELFWRKRWGLL